MLRRRTSPHQFGFVQSDMFPIESFQPRPPLNKLITLHFPILFNPMCIKAVNQCLFIALSTLRVRFLRFVRAFVMGEFFLIATS